MQPPQIWFITKIFHPNVHWSTGELCLDILKTDWTPVWNLKAVLRAIVALLVAPNGDSPLNCDAGNMVRNGDMRAFNSMAKMYTIDCAMEGAKKEEFFMEDSSSDEEDPIKDLF